MFNTISDEDENRSKFELALFSPTAKSIRFVFDELNGSCCNFSTNLSMSRVSASDIVNTYSGSILAVTSDTTRF